MKQRYYIFLLFVAMLSYSGYAQKSILRLSQQTLMHEVRETPSPLDGQHIAVNPPRFMWPDKFPHLGPVLDGVPVSCSMPKTGIRSSSGTRIIRKRSSIFRKQGNASIIH